ncbi:NAD(P)/FAD-dependent oxidoreductase [Actinoplanes sp. NPDC089786]|uniref:flavin-containing monooxygenase n=1 Tax=Actinoplanes sp. NPDC089786 TaxID=3155185 RepID=UPI0034148F42
MENVTVLGAGAAGLGVAAALKARGVDSVVLERGPGVGSSWRGRYDRLKLHTTRRLSGLPGLPIPREYGRWVRRDDLVRYLEAYAAKFDLDVRTGATVESIKPGWSLTLADGAEHTTETLVVATGYLHTPVVPDWPGRESWAGTLLHSSAYRNAEPFRGQDVLVAGIGNSGAEIASDLAAGGAASVRIAIRTPPHIIRREVAGWPAQLSGVLLGGLPERVFNPLAATLARFEVPDLRAYGIVRPAEGAEDPPAHQALRAAAGCRHRPGRAGPTGGPGGRGDRLHRDVGAAGRRHERATGRRGRGHRLRHRAARAVRRPGAVRRDRGAARPRRPTGPAGPVLHRVRRESRRHAAPGRHRGEAAGYPNRSVLTRRGS